MEKNYKNKEIKGTEKVVKNKQSFFFPKANPPRTVEAETVEEALQIINNK